MLYPKSRNRLYYTCTIHDDTKYQGLVGNSLCLDARFCLPKSI